MNIQLDILFWIKFYLPSKENLAAQSKVTDRRGDILTGDQANEVLNLLKMMLKEHIIIMRQC